MAGYIGPIPVPQATQSRETFTATASQTSFGTAGYQVGYLDVFMNGVKLAPADFTATNGSDVVLASGAAVNDIIEVVSYSAFEVLNQNFTGTTVVDNLTVGGNLTVDGTTTTINSTTLNVDDINITVASGAADSAAANGAGLTVDGANATFNYSHSGTKWTMNKPLDVGGNLDVTGTVTMDGGSTSADFTFGDNDKAIFGDGSDLKIYHNGSNSYIQETGTGNLFVASDANVNITNQATSELKATFISNGAVNLYYDNAKKFATSSSGIDVSGGIVASPNTAGKNTFELSTSSVDEGRLRIKNVDTTTVQIRAGGDSYFNGGKLLVGKTSSDYATEGVEIRDNEVLITKAGANPLSVRNNGAGGLISFNSAGASVGSIGASGANMIMGTGATGIYFNNASQSVHPWNISANQARNGAIDLGRGTDQFRNIYINGGVVFGDASGASVDNQTQSTYERGTWTPVWTASNQVAYNVSGYQYNVGQYVRIGDYVFCNLYLQHTGSFSGTTSWLRLSGLPYSSVSTLSNLTAGAVYNWGGFTGLGQGDQMIFRTQVGTNQGYFQVTNGGTGRNVTQNDFGGALSFACSFSYRAS